MRPPGRLVRRGLAAIFATSLAVGAVSFAGAHDSQGPDIKVATVSGGRCGTPADSLPVLVAKSGARPGEVVGDVTVCVTSRGDPPWTVLSLRAVELVDVDGSCTGSEAAVDTTCGAGKRGELSASLVQQVGVGACPAVADARLVTRRGLSDIGTVPILLGLMRRSELLCVRVRLRYEPANAAAAAASQSDRATWRYAFSLTGIGDFDD